MRDLVVGHSASVTPKMVRLTLVGEALAGFTSPAPDDHIKVFAGEHSEERRDYTPRRFNPDTNELVVDFAMHDAGPVTQWARNAKVGDPARIGGPRGSVIIPDDFDWWLLIGDETALPAIGRRIEETSVCNVTSIVAVAGPEEEQTFVTTAAHKSHWVHRSASEADNPAPLLAALKAFVPPPGDGFIWIAAEANVARPLRQHALAEMNHPFPWIKASGYWLKGSADAAENFDR
jgi:NADPH-dependent ferric siderophore reductase